MEHILRATGWLVLGLLLECLCYGVGWRDPSLFKGAFVAQIPLTIGLLACARGPYGTWAVAALLAPLCRTGLTYEAGGPTQGDLYKVCYFGQVAGYFLMLGYAACLSFRMRRRALALGAGGLIVVPVLALLSTARLHWETRHLVAHLIVLTTLGAYAAFFALVRRAVKTVPVEW